MLCDGRLYIDNTIYKSVFGCSLQLVLRHILHWNSREESTHLRAGTAMHESQAVWNRALCEGAPADQARDAAIFEFQKHYEQYSREWVEPDNRLAYDNLALILDEWYLRHHGRLPWMVPDPRLIEVGFAYPLDAQSGRDVAFGRFDLIVRVINDGTWAVVDHKSTGRIDLNWVDQWSIDSQISQYTWGALQHVPDLAGFFVNGIEFSKLPSSDRKCRDHGIPYNQCAPAHMHSRIVGPIGRAPEMLARWHADAVRGAEKYRFYAEHYDPALVGTTPDLSNVEMEGPFTGACRFCAFKDWCRTGRNAAMLPAMYVQDEWRPFDPREFEGRESPVAEVVG